MAGGRGCCEAAVRLLCQASKPYLCVETVRPLSVVIKSLLEPTFTTDSAPQPPKDSTQNAS